ncbi:hypothetical protein HZ994_11000 [Akkermansiaceae bacterium]|nr:hypothetical protein HZ994_11000 [Akkermansiaceae bacterium]
MSNRFLIPLCLMLPLSAGLQAAITFSVVFTSQAEADLSASDRAKFTDGLAFWDAIIDGYQDGRSYNWVLTVDTFSQAASGGGVLLGSAGPEDLYLSNVVPGSGLGGSWPDRYILSGSGFSQFNTHPDADIEPGPDQLNASTIRHEIGHALGIGTLWEDNEVYNDGIGGNHNRTATVGTPGQYIGANGLSIYQSEFDPTAAFIPIERDGGPGTADGHWNMVADHFNSSLENQPGFDSDPGDGGPAPTVLFGPNLGLSLDDELMTGVSSGSRFISETTKASLIDIGFTLHSSPVPEPAVFAHLALAFGLAARRRR